MGSVSFGGDPESYMDPPRMTQTDKPGGGNIIASILQLVGLTGDKAAGGGKQQPAPKMMEPEIKEGGANPLAPVALPALDSAESAFKPIEPLPTDWGKKYLDSMKPIISIDPNDAIKGM